MRAFWKQLVLFLGIFGLLLTMAGCGGESGGGGNGAGDTEIKQAITVRINAFKTAVEAYDVEGMLDFLNNTDAADKVTIAEAGIGSYFKDYTTLKIELEEDRGKQIYWRQSPPVGKGYTLTMKLETITYSNLNASGAYAVVPFTIIEAAQAPEIGPDETDRGNMVCEMVNFQGTWRCQKMTINFYSPGRSVSSVKIATPLASSKPAYKNERSQEGTAGFGFGDFEALLKNNK